MHKLIKMIDHVTHHGLLFPPEMIEHLKAVNITEESMERDFFDFAEKARAFVFVPRSQAHLSDAPESTDIIGCPFPIFSIEMSGGSPVTGPRPGEEPVYIESMLVVESVPGKYITFVFMHDRERGLYAVTAPKGIEGLVQEFVDRINTEKSGLERVRVKTTLGRGKSKRRHEIREVIHISPTPTKYEGHGSRPIDWSHRFEVRGHWRKTDGIGKNREGQYVVEGYTWVKEHVRGPEELPLVKKQRVVHT